MRETGFRRAPVRVIVLAGLAIHRHNRSVADGFQHCEEVQVELMDLHGIDYRLPHCV
jgi:hypothetical protein